MASRPVRVLVVLGTLLLAPVLACSSSSDCSTYEQDYSVQASDTSSCTDICKNALSTTGSGTTVDSCDFSTDHMTVHCHYLAPGSC